MSDGDAEDAMYFKGVEDARKFWIARCDHRLHRVREERKKLSSKGLVNYWEGYVAALAWARKQGEIDRFIDPKADNEDDLVPPWNSLP